MAAPPSAAYGLYTASGTAAADIDCGRCARPEIELLKEGDDLCPEPEAYANGCTSPWSGCVEAVLNGLGDGYLGESPAGPSISAVGGAGCIA